MLDAYAAAGVAASVVGAVTEEPRVAIAVGDAGQPCIAGSTAQLRDAWEATGFQLERLQVAPDVGSKAQTLSMRLWDTKPGPPLAPCLQTACMPNGRAQSLAL